MKPEYRAPIGANTAVGKHSYDEYPLASVLNLQPGACLYVYHRERDHQMQILLAPGNMVVVLWEDTVPSVEIMPWIPSDYRVLPERWSEVVLSINMQKWSKRNAKLIEVGVDAVEYSRRLLAIAERTTEGS